MPAHASTACTAAHAAYWHGGWQHSPSPCPARFTCTTFWPEYLTASVAEECGGQYNTSVGLCLDGMNEKGLAVASLGVFQPADAQYSEWVRLALAPDLVAVGKVRELGWSGSRLEEGGFAINGRRCSASSCLPTGGFG